MRAIQEALEAGEDILTTNVNGWTAAMFAVGANEINALRVLIDSGIDLNLANSDGVTPLMLAAINGNKVRIRYERRVE